MRLIMDMPYIGLISVIVGITNMIPFFGPFIGAIPSAIIVFSDSPQSTIPFLIFIFILQQIDGNIIGPKCIGSSTGLSTFWIIVAIMIFGDLLGVFGMFFGVPMFAILYDIVNRYIKYKSNLLGLDKQDAS